MKSFADPQNKNLIEIFESNRYEVPRFQREYAWGTDEIKEFWQDLESITKEDKESIFLGNFIFLDDDPDGKMLTIIDGQQRLTTLQLLLIAVRTRAKQLKSKVNDNTLQVSHINSLIEYYGSKFSNIETTEVKRLRVEKTIRPLFDIISEYKWDGIIPQKIKDLDGRKYRKMKRKVEPIYTFFYERVQNFNTQEITELLNSLEKVFVTKIVLQDPTAAFDIFERTNARGVRLAQSDLVKNMLFQKADEEFHDEIEKKWSDITTNSSDKLSQMLKYYVTTLNGKTLKKDIFQILKERENKTGPQELINELSIFSLFYKMMLEEGSVSTEVSSMTTFFKELDFSLILEDPSRKKEIIRSITAFQLFGITQVYPLLFSYIKCLQRVNFEIEEKNKTAKNKKTANEYLLQFIQRLENFHFINTIVCNNIGNQVESLYSRYSYSEDLPSFGRVMDLNAFIETEKNFKNELISERETRKTFMSLFADFGYEDNDRNLIRYVFDRISNTESKGAQIFALYDPDQSTKKKECNIEHFYPRQKFENAGDSVGIDSGNNIGNLLVIPLHSNSAFSDATPKEKYSLIHKDPKHFINIGNAERLVMQYKDDEWNKDLIEKRADDLAGYGFDHTWNFS